MENESRFGRIWQSISDKIQDQMWFQQLKTKWDELDVRTRTVLKYGSLVGSVFVVLSLVVSSSLSVYGKKKDLDDKLGLVQKIQSAQEELRKLKQVTVGAGISGDGTPWSAYFESQAVASGIEATTVKVGGEKSLTPQDKEKNSDTTPHESLLEVSVPKVNLRQLVKFVFNIENGGRTAKVRKLQVNTQPDESGYLDVTVAVSGFTLKAGN